MRYRDAPHPLREFFLLFAVTFVIMMVLTPFTEGLVARVATVAFGGSMLLIGFSLITNLGGATSFYTELNKTRGWFGTDNSKSVFTRPPFMRLAGAAFVFVGFVFVQTGITGQM